MKYLLLSLCLHIGTILSSQLNMELLSNLEYTSSGNDVWGYNAPDGSEYALMGTVRGVSVVNITDHRNPVEVDFINQQNSTWRDIKTWGSYAYAVADQGGTDDGILIIDLSDLPNSISSENINPTVEGQKIDYCHNLYIDDGIAYIAGCSGPSSRINDGGIIMFDVETTPEAPSLVGLCPPVYSHDVYTRDNKVYSSEIFEGHFAVYDVSDKDNVKFLASQPTPFQFTHNSWLSDDGNTIFTTDERGNAPVASYDISNLDNIKYLDEFVPKATQGTGVIPHNVHVWEDWLIISYYSDGCILVDASRPDNLIEVGNFDTALGNGAGFRGVWGAYPFFNSGNIILGDIQNGLYVVGPDYKRACYLEGVVTDGSTGVPINNVTIELVELADTESTSSIGTYKTGTVFPGSYTIIASADGYKPVTKTLELTNGVVTNGDFQLGRYEAIQAFCTGAETSSLEVSWDSNASAIAYDIYLDGVFIQRTFESSHIFTGLQAVTTYEITVVANFEGCAPLSSDIACMTAAFQDMDGDGFTSDLDCDDTNDMIFPGNAESCDNIDNNCDGQIDEGLALISYYEDVDGDGYGNGTVFINSCSAISGYVTNGSDCDDNAADINPGATELPYNGIDDDCNTTTLDDDLDQDGYNFADDCDDNNSGINPAATELCNNIDENCNGLIDEGLAESTFYQDNDNDGYGDSSQATSNCFQPTGYVVNNEDCNDNDPNINPQQIELPYNGIDEDCNPMTLDDDFDQDGFILADDCDDNDANINPSTIELPYTGIDEDCDPTTLDDDLDQDGFVLADDCDDNDANVNPSAIEIPYSGLDEDCDPTTLDDDLDQDGFVLADDCDDNNANVNPSAIEIPYSGIDEDCDPTTLDDDLDQDGFVLADDCDDEDPIINPDAVDIPNNGVDEDCDGSDFLSSINDISTAKIYLYPNPVSEELKIDIEGELQFQVYLYDLLGNRLLSVQNQSSINITGLNDGPYFIVIEDLNTKQKVTNKIIVQR